MCVPRLLPTPVNPALSLQNWMRGGGHLNVCLNQCSCSNFQVCLEVVVLSQTSAYQKIFTPSSLSWCSVQRVVLLLAGSSSTAATTNSGNKRTCEQTFETRTTLTIITGIHYKFTDVGVREAAGAGVDVSTLVIIHHHCCVIRANCGC